MSPHDIDANVDYKRLHQLSDEFTQNWNRLQALYLDAVAGFAFVRSHVDSDQARARSLVRGTELDSEKFQDSRIFTYTEIFARDFCASAIHSATQGEVKARNVPGGTNFAILGQLCLISFYHFWNDYLRREYVIAKGLLRQDEQSTDVVEDCLREHASHDLWGDLRLLRQSIVHNNGIANSAVKRCKLIRWFEPGDPISITPEQMRAIFLALLKYRNDLFAEGFPKHYIQVPSN